MRVLSRGGFLSAEQARFERNADNIDGRANEWLCYHFTHFHGTLRPVPHLIIALRSLKTALRKVPGVARLARLCRILGDPAYRSEWRLARARPEHLFQPYGCTVFDRHSRVFAFIREQLSDGTARRILSYGCSTGEEVFSLRDYFPQAEIVGIDINPRSIDVCRKKLRRSGDGRIRFARAATPWDQVADSYDAVLCLSVLRHGDLTANRAERCDHLIRFTDFEHIVNGLCHCLKPGGLLVILGSNFRFSDAATAKVFDVVYRIDQALQRADTPLFGRDNCKLENGLYNDAVFRKKARL
ncbi:class I SAM-dependent methyltransferase [Methylomonas methanica]|uniref:class I SAM-dependent methyltransferase n=1 Tax=Methylomonas methanica TaxID=421 RepID=UPI0006749935|nr:class I SAM-dependent methyltransferase [Methylomonas methanica]